MNDRKPRLTIDKLDSPYLIEDRVVPFLWRVGHAQRLGHVRNLAVMPADDNHLARILAAQYLMGERPGLAIFKVILDTQPQCLRQRRDRLNGAIAVLAH